MSKKKTSSSKSVKHKPVVILLVVLGLAVVAGGALIVISNSDEGQKSLDDLSFEERVAAADPAKSVEQLQQANAEQKVALETLSSGPEKASGHLDLADDYLVASNYVAAREQLVFAKEEIKMLAEGEERDQLALRRRQTAQAVELQESYVQSLRGEQ